MDGALAARLKATAMVVSGGDEVRKVCLAFESVEVGQHMLAWATKYCLFPDDEVYIVHCLSKVRTQEHVSLQRNAHSSVPPPCM